MGKIIIAVLILINFFYCYSQTSDSTAIQKHINYVVDKIWSTIGFPLQKPSVELIQSEINPADARSLAYYEPIEKKIYITKGAYNLCMSIGEEALAGLLAHEMGHYYYKHISYFNSIGKLITNFQRKFLPPEFEVAKSCEAEADFFAVYRCLLANYDISSAFPKIIDTVYKIFNVPEDNVIYLSKTQRKEIVYKAFSIIDSLTPLYELAYLLYIVGKYKESAEIYDFISDYFFKTWDTYLNAGLNYLLLLYDYYNGKFLYPFQLGVNKIIKSRIVDLSLKSITLPSSEFDRKVFISLKESAELRLLKAIDLFPQSSLIQCYLACFYHICGDTNNALGIINNIVKPENDIETFVYFLTISIVNSYDLVSANQYLNIAANLEYKLYGDSSVTHYNRLALNQPDSLVNFKPQAQSYLVTGGQQIISYENILQITPFNLQSLPTKKVSFQSSNFSAPISYELYVGPNFVAYSFGDSKFVVTKDNYDLPSGLGVKIGSSIETLKKTYGYPPSRVITSMDSYFFIYNDFKIAFKIKDKKIAGWFIFN